LYKRAGILIEDYANKLNKLSFTKRPSKRNPKMLLGFDKTIYYALLFFRDKYGHRVPTTFGTAPNHIIPTDKMVKMIKEAKSENKKNQSYFRF